MKIKAAIYTFLLFYLASAVIVCADTTIVNTRTGEHKNFIRFVLDSEGDYPLSIKHYSGNSLDIGYENLVLTKEEENKLIKKLDAAFSSALQNDNGVSHLKLSPHSSNARVETSYLASNTGADNGYRLVIDIYPQPTVAEVEKGSAAVPLPVEKNEKVKVSIGEQNSNISKTGIIPGENSPGKTEVVSGAVSGEMEADKTGNDRSNRVAPELASASETVPVENNDNTRVSVEDKKSVISEAPVPPVVDISGKAEIILTNTDGDESSKFDEYSDRTKSVTGNLEINRTRENRSELRIKMKDIGRDDQNATLEGEIYGTAKVQAEYDELPHRYQYGARTLYSGIGSSNLTLDDSMQSDMETTLYPDVANKLSAYFENAVSGDPMIIRKKGYLNIEWVKFTPLKFDLELTKEKKNGTIPRFGSLGSGNTVELPEPVDYDSTQVRFTGEFKKGRFLLNTSYYFSAFENENKFLSWDSPLNLNDYLYSSSRGQLGLAPDNSYHNISMSGLISSLPYYTRISANAALGWMYQDDILAPYTVNTAVTAPDVPVGSIDGEVKTRLLNFLLTSSPFNSVNLKLKFRSYEYKNNTTPVTFPGYASVDDFFNTTPVISLASGYKKDTMEAGLRKDLFRDLRLAFNYKWEKTERSNREVSNQDDRVYKVSLDSTHSAWLYLKAAYEKTERDTENYIFDSYLESGSDLYQNPLLRKYDEADVKRDRIEIHAGVTPWNKLAFSLSYIYGKDDFDNSTYGLLEDRHGIFTFDTDLTLSKSANLHLFYSIERYRNLTAGNGFTGSGITDWTVNGNDRVNTYGGNFTTRLFAENLDLDIAYSYSKADGKLNFAVDGEGYSSFNEVDNSIFHNFDTEIKYRAGEKWACSLGFLWEKASFNDYNKEGFTYVPADGSDIGFYQGALLMGILPEDYDITQLYFKVSRFF